MLVTQQEVLKKKQKALEETLKRLESKIAFYDREIQTEEAKEEKTRI